MSEYWTRRRKRRQQKMPMTTTMMMMIGNLLRVKDLTTTNGEDSSRARAYACAPHISPSQTQKSAPPATTPRGDKKSDDDSIAKRERERERERETKKSAAHLLLVTTRIGRQYIRGIDVVWIPIRTTLRTSSKCNASSSSPPLSRAQ